MVHFPSLSSEGAGLVSGEEPPSSPLFIRQDSAVETGVNVAMLWQPLLLAGFAQL